MSKTLTHKDVEKAEAKVIDPTDNAYHIPEVIEALPPDSTATGKGNLFYVLDTTNSSFQGPYPNKDAAERRLRKFAKSPTGHGPLHIIEASAKPDVEARPADSQR